MRGSEEATEHNAQYMQDRAATALWFCCATGAFTANTAL